MRCDDPVRRLHPDREPAGIHYSHDRVGPYLYAGGNYIEIAADLSGRARRLTVSTDDRACNLAAASA